MSYKLVVYGFLGSGKTTLINRLAREVFPARRIVVIENESGRESVDGEHLRSGGLEVVDLRAGCVCCTLRGELAATVTRIERETAPEILILEPSGICALEELLQTPGFTPDAFVTLVDATHFDLLMQVNRAFYLRQFRLSPVLLLTKCELAGPQTTARIRQELERANPLALVSEAGHPFDAPWWCDTLPGICSRFRTFMPGRGAPAARFLLHTFDLTRPLAPERLAHRLRCASDENRASGKDRSSGKDRAAHGHRGPVRVKGFIDTSQGTLRVDAVESHIALVPADYNTCAQRFLTFWWCEPADAEAMRREAEKLINSCSL